MEIFINKGVDLMLPVKEQIVNMIDMLPENEQNLAYEFIKRMVLAWDPDYTKVTSEERKTIQIADNEILHDEVINHNDIDWS